MFLIFHRRLEGDISYDGFGINGTTPDTGDFYFTDEQMQMLTNNRYVIAADQIYGSTILIPTGIILNLLSFVIFYKIKKYKSAPGSHIMCMAFADNCALLGILGAQDNSFSKDKPIPNIQDLNIVLCKGANIFFNSGALWSGFLLASATVERYCCIAYPLKVRLWNMGKLSKILNIVYFFASFGLNIPAGYDLYILKQDNQTFCISPFGGYGDIIDQIVNGILSHIIVTVIILIFTIAIAVHLKRMRNNRKTLCQSAVVQRSKEYVITTMLFAVACLFLVTRLPIVVVFEVARFYDSTVNIDVRTLQLIEISASSAILLLVIHNGCRGAFCSFSGLFFTNPLIFLYCLATEWAH